MTDWITQWLMMTGYIGIAALMLGENIFPPIPSEIIMPLAGFLAAQGTLSLWLVIISGTIGAFAGALIWYYIGKWLGQARLKRFAAQHGRWIALSPSDIDRAGEWFHRHGALAVFISRCIPGLRTYISIPAGITNMPLAPFLLFTALGSLVWTALLTACGYVLQQNYEAVSVWLDPVLWVVVGTITATYIWRVIRYKP